MKPSDSNQRYAAVPTPIQRSTASFFTELSSLDSQCVLKQLDVRRFLAGEYVREPIIGAGAWFIVLDGVLEVCYSKIPNRIVVLDRIERGQLVCGDRLGVFGFRNAEIRCVTRSVLGKLDVETFERCMIELPSFMLFATRSMRFQILKLTSKLLEFATEDVPSRLLEALRRLPEVHEHSARDDWMVRQPPTQIELAKMIGSSREVVGRAMRLLESAGEIERRGRRVYIRGS